MNRYTAQGLVADAAAGKTVLVADRRAFTRSDALDEIVRAAGNEATRVIRINGLERVDFSSGGSIRLAFSCSHTADVVFLADHADGEDLNVMRSALLVTSASRYGEVIRAE